MQLDFQRELASRWNRLMESVGLRLQWFLEHNWLDLHNSQLCDHVYEPYWLLRDDNKLVAHYCSHFSLLYLAQSNGLASSIRRYGILYSPHLQHSCGYRLLCHNLDRLVHGVWNSHIHFALRTTAWSRYNVAYFWILGPRCIWKLVWD